MRTCPAAKIQRSLRLPANSDKDTEAGQEERGQEQSSSSCKSGAHLLAPCAQCSRPLKTLPPRPLGLSGETSSRTEPRAATAQLPLGFPVQPKAEAMPATEQALGAQLHRPRASASRWGCRRAARDRSEARTLAHPLLEVLETPPPPGAPGGGRGRPPDRWKALARPDLSLGGPGGRRAAPKAPPGCGRPTRKLCRVGAPLLSP